MGKNTFENLTSIQKVQLYLLVPMLFWLLLFVFENYLLQNLQSGTLQNSSTIIDIPKKKIDKISITKSIQFIEEKAKYYQLQTNHIQQKQKTIMVEFLGSYKDILGFLQKIKLHFEILSFQVIREEKLTTLHLTVNNKYFFNKELIKKEFHTEKENRQSKLQVVNIKLEAIVDKEVLIDGLWYKKGDSYKVNKIIDIKNTSIELEDKNTKQKFKVELINESL